jgi:hypothetical protein
MLSAFNQLRNDAAQGQQTLVDVARLDVRPCKTVNSGKTGPQGRKQAQSRSGQHTSLARSLVAPDRPMFSDPARSTRFSLPARFSKTIHKYLLKTPALLKKHVGKT